MFWECDCIAWHGKLWRWNELESVIVRVDWDVEGPVNHRLMDRKAIINTPVSRWSHLHFFLAVA